MAMLSQQTKLLIFTTVFFGVFFSHAQETTQTEQTISKAITLDKLMSERISFNKSEKCPRSIDPIHGKIPHKCCRNQISNPQLQSLDSESA